VNAVLELNSLSAREREVLAGLAEGRSVKEVAGALQISWETARHHINNIYQKLHVHSRTEAILKFLGHPQAGPR
jgi:DNA-binding NarL/FixJ family response regulator